MKCNNFHVKYKSCISASCPLGNGGSKWRKRHNLGAVGRSFNCTKKSPEPFHSVISHCSQCSDIFHRAVMKYVNYCSEHLPSVTAYELKETSEGVWDIIDKRTYQPPNPHKNLRCALPDGYDEVSVDYEGSDDDVDTSDTQESAEGSNEHD